jgi:hypothetical protein
MWSADPGRSVDGHGGLPWVEPRKTRIGLIAHHWALGTGHRAADLAGVAELLGLELTVVAL